MSQAIKAARQSNQITVPGIMIPAASVLWKNFGDSITRMKAAATRETRNSSDLMSEYGFSHKSIQDSRFTFNYERNKDIGGNITNPINDRFISDAESHISQRAATYDKGKPLLELSTTFLTVEVEDDRIQEESGTNNSRFDLIFRSQEPAGSNGILKETKKLYEKFDIHKQGMKYRNLDLLKVIESNSKYNGGDENVVAEWQGYGDETANLPLDICQAVLDNHLKKKLPSGTATMKRFKWGVGDAHWQPDGYTVV